MFALMKMGTSMKRCNGKAIQAWGPKWKGVKGIFSMILTYLHFVIFTCILYIQLNATKLAI